MESRAKILGHPIHQTLVVLPLGSLAIAVVFDIIHLATGQPTFAIVAYWMILAGIVTGILAAPFGTVDWAAIPKNTRAKRIGAMYGIGNGVVLLLFIISWWLRVGAPADPPVAAVVFAVAGALLAIVTGWLGGELVDRHGVGVHDGAHLDAPSSLERSSIERSGRR
jgi:uncharacterized membrane protein